MVRDGQLIHQGQFLIAISSMIGVISCHSDGYGFVDCGRSSSAFVAKHRLRGLMNGDLVKAEIYPSKQGLEVKSIELIKRRLKYITGRLISQEGTIYLTPLYRVHNYTVLIEGEVTTDNITGQLVKAKIINWQSDCLRAEIVEYLPDNQTHLDGIISAFELPCQWSEAVNEQVDLLAAKRDQIDENRIDLTHLPFITIDGKTAKDFDDAIYVEQQDKGYCLWVAIADVAYFVPQDSALDKQARLRGNSVYFDGHCIPMLPHDLSDDWCSLLANEPRKVMVCKAWLDDKACLDRFEFMEGLIVSRSRQTYSSIDAWLIGDKTPADINLDPTAVTSVQMAKKLANLRLKQRVTRKALDFDLPSYELQLDQNNQVTAITKNTRLFAHHLIEELMIVANICAAKQIDSSSLPATVDEQQQSTPVLTNQLFRVHAQPSAKKLTQLAELFNKCGAPIALNKRKPEAMLHQLISVAQAHEEKVDLLQVAILRSMPPASYSDELNGHFGLALTHYTHFTSPIRRYSDLVVHRIIKQQLAGHDATELLSVEELQSVCLHCSQTERVADKATQMYRRLLVCEFAKQYLDCTTSGKINFIRPDEVSVFLPEYGFEASLLQSDLTSQGYAVVPEEYAIIHKRKKTQYSFG